MRKISIGATGRVIVITRIVPNSSSTEAITNITVEVKEMMRLAIRAIHSQNVHALLHHIKCQSGNHHPGVGTTVDEMATPVIAMITPRFIQRFLREEEMMLRSWGPR
jgi:hypothetical protein